MKIQEGCDRWLHILHHSQPCAGRCVRWPLCKPCARKRGDWRQAGYQRNRRNRHSSGRATVGEPTRYAASTPSLRACTRHRRGRVRTGFPGAAGSGDGGIRRGACPEMPKLARQFHLSMQTGSDGGAEAHAPAATPPAEYLSPPCETLRQAHARIAPITTDVIAGFPGETEEEHRATDGLCAKGAPSPASTCSPIPAAPAPRADRMENQVPEEYQALSARGN